MRIMNYRQGHCAVGHHMLGVNFSGQGFMALLYICKLLLTFRMIISCLGCVSCFVFVLTFCI